MRASSSKSKSSLYYHTIESQFIKEILSKTSLRESKAESLASLLIDKVLVEKIQKKECEDFSKEFFKEKTIPLIDYLYDMINLDKGIITYNQKPEKILSKIVNPNINKQSFIGKELLKKKREHSEMSAETKPKIELPKNIEKPYIELPKKIKIELPPEILKKIKEMK